MDKNIVLYVIVGLLILGLFVLTFFPGLIYAFRDSASSGADKCSPPAGSDYTEESWREHMSHHPSIYKECLT